MANLAVLVVLSRLAALSQSWLNENRLLHLILRLTQRQDTQQLFDARLHRRGEFLHFPRAVARVGEDEVDVVAIVGVVDGDVFRFADDEMSAG